MSDPSAETRDLAARPAPAGFAWPRPDGPVAFVPVPHGREETEGSSKSNRAEAEGDLSGAARYLKAAVEIAPTPEGTARLALEQGRIALLQPLVNGRVHRRQRPQGAAGAAALGPCPDPCRPR